MSDSENSRTRPNWAEMADAEDDLIAFRAYEEMSPDELLARTKDLHRRIRIALGYRQMTHVLAALREGLKLP